MKKGKDSDAANSVLFDNIKIVSRDAIVYELHIQCKHYVQNN